MFDKRLSGRAVHLAATLAILAVSTISVQAAILSGSGAHVPIPSPNPGDPGGVPLTQVPWTAGGGFTGTWTSPANPDWIGTIQATGPIPQALSSGITNYDFTTLPTGVLPAGTIFYFGDVDGGSTLSEMIDLTAYDSTNAEIELWLDEPIGVWGTGASGGSPVITDLPGWDYDNITPKTYRIDGATVTGGNPSVSVTLVSNQPIATLEVNKHATHFSFGLRAPVVPEPATTTMIVGAMLSASVLLIRRGKTK